MNKLNGIVVENLSLEFGQELKKTFEELGVYTRNYAFAYHKKDNDNVKYYGVINELFSVYDLEEVQQSNAKIITLEQLKAMKNPYPKMMYVSDEPIEDDLEFDKHKVYFEKEIEGVNYYFAKHSSKDIYASFKYAVDLDYFDNEVKEITLQDILSECKEAIESKFGKNFKVKSLS